MCRAMLTGWIGCVHSFRYAAKKLGGPTVEAPTLELA